MLVFVRVSLAVHKLVLVRSFSYTPEASFHEELLLHRQTDELTDRETWRELRLSLDLR